MEVSALKYSGGIGLHGRTPLLRLQSDERLITLLRRGNMSAFEVLVARYESRLMAFCRHLLGSREDAEDVLQEVMTAAFNAILADDRPINVRPWLYRIARNRSLNHLRRIQAVGVDSMDHHFSEHGASTADKVHEREEFRLLVGDIHELPETQKTALVLREMDALPYEQIAEAMETTVPSVKSLLVRARVSLAEAAEARLLSCNEVRIELAEVAEGLQRRPNPLVRRHLRECKRCSEFRSQLKQTNRALAALLPLGPLAVFHKLVFLHLGHSAGAGSGATAAGSGAAAAGSGAAAAGSGAAAAGSGAAAAGGAAGTAALAGSGAVAGSSGFISAGIGAVAGKAAATLAAAALVTAGAVEANDHHAHHHAGGAAVAQAPAVATESPSPSIAPAAPSYAEPRSSVADASAVRKTMTTDVVAAHPSTRTTADKTATTSTAADKTATTSTAADKTATTSTTPTTTSTTPTTSATTPARTRTTGTTPSTSGQTPEKQSIPGRTQTQSDPTVLPSATTATITPLSSYAPQPVSTYPANTVAPAPPATTTPATTTTAPATTTPAPPTTAPAPATTTPAPPTTPTSPTPTTPAQEPPATTTTPGTTGP